MASARLDYQRQIYLAGLQGIVPQTTNLSKLEVLARKKLDEKAYWYVAGAASTGSTHQGNLAAFKRYKIVPRMLNNVSIEDFDTSIELFGKTFSTPLLVAPIGVQAQLHPEADMATARAAAQLDVPFVLSSAASVSMERVAEANGDGCRWFQLYWPSDDRVTKSLLDRASKSGYTALVVTLDTWSLGWRPNDLDTAYNPFLKGEGVANLFSDPVFINEYLSGISPLHPDATEEDKLHASLQAIRLLTPGFSRKWSDLALLKQHWKGPIILKGIQHLEDAKQAVKAGVQGVIVSNHGGRQVDGAIASLDCLSSISKYLQKHKVACLFDSGIRSGADIFKAIALGAQAVLIGRPWAYGFALQGQKGVEDVFSTLLADFVANSALAGCKDVHAIQRHCIVDESELAKL